MRHLKYLAAFASPRTQVIALVLVGSIASATAAAESRMALFGDLHVHTGYSMDAFQFGTRTRPDDAYQFARGAPVVHAEGFKVQLDAPLDFYAVTDHAEYLGAMTLFGDPSHPFHQAAAEAGILDTSASAAKRSAATAFVASHTTRQDLQRAWREVVEAANRHNNPGEFTTFVAFEYTSSRGGGNLHRNVVFAGQAAPVVPFGRFDSLNPEDLWRWMDSQRGQGMEVLAIPHNANGSDGHMFQRVTWDGRPIDAAYASLRMRNEPIVEITQVKGTSETHPFLSPNDEWAGFEIFPYRIGSWAKSRPRGSYVRDALLTGLELDSNPYRFGFVGASDTHNSGSRSDEATFAGKVGLADATPVRRGSVPASAPDEAAAYRNVYRILFGASGITGVWADANTREAIFAALQRKETFATSGSRIRVRLFAGPDLPNGLARMDDMADLGYAFGVPMGGTLTKNRKPPRFAVVAMQDPLAAPLQRLQIVKGWIDNGQRQEQVFDIACSDGLSVDKRSHRCPDNSATVDLTTCKISAGVGASQLSATWTDPTFKRDQQAFYYARVLENPTCRWSTWDAIRAGVSPRAGIDATLQDRAWTSPVWYDPR